MKTAIAAEIPTVPGDWETVAVGDVCCIENGCPFKSEFFNDKEGLPIIRIRDVHSGRSDTFFSGPYDKEYLVSNGDLLVGMDGEFRVRKWNGGTGLLNQRVCRLVPNENQIDRGFLCFAIGKPLKQIEDFTPYTTVKHISASQIRSIVLPYPVLSEQRRIASVLGLVQRAIEQQERLIALTTELKKSLMHKLFTEGLRGERQKQTEIGAIPESWEVVTLGEYLTEAQYGISVKGSESGRYAVLRMTNQRHGRVSPDKLQYVELTADQFRKFRVERKDILFNRTNSLDLVGRTAIFALEGDFVFASYLIRLRTNVEYLRPFFLNHYFNWEETQVRLKSIATRAVSQSNISATRLRSFLVPVPKAEEQDKIVEKVDCLDQKLLVHGRKKATLTDLFCTLLHQLMTAQIRVRDLDLSFLEQDAVAS